MTAIVISGGESGRDRELVRALERGSGRASMDDEALIHMAAEGRGGGHLALSWALLGIHPLADRMVMERHHGRAQVCQTMVTALGRGVRIFYGDLGHLLKRFPVAVFRVLLSGGGDGGRGRARRRKRLFGESFLSHTLYDMYLPGGSGSVEEEARAILERTALAVGDPGRPLPADRLQLAADMAEAELDLVRRGVDVEFGHGDRGVTVWNRSGLENAELEERVRRIYALGTISCRRGDSPPIFENRVPYSLRMRVEGEWGVDKAVAVVRGRNGGRMGSSKTEVLLHSGLGWGGRILVDLPETLADPEEVVWRLRALYPGRGLILPSPRYAWLASRMGLEVGIQERPRGEQR